MKPPELHFLIPFYSNVPYLKEAVASVVAQSSSHWRLTVIDDSGAPGNEVETMLGAFRDPRIKYLKNPRNLGIASNWNRCLAVAETDLINILHADDRLDPEFAARNVAASLRYPEAAAIFCRVRIIGHDGRPSWSVGDLYKQFLRPSSDQEFQLVGEAGVTALLRGDFIFCPSLVYRRSKLRGEAFDASWSQVLDLEFLCRLLLLGHSLVGIPDQVFEYRRHAASQTGLLTETRRRFSEESKLYQHLAQVLAARGWRLAAATAARQRIIKLHLIFQALKALLGGRWRGFGAYWTMFSRLGSGGGDHGGQH
ncbi:hypothetical protein E3A20_08490 [Planctomyces bekefii]|uniref:Glycosyltransferase 2-like domain-containing protein n=1 Tax=Planctomyces bekefii TaxID=1653850 RepID=A0A5C6M5W7_9PLAN|nr:hypothetical protein E3A20_08490 [Planctomyces bekefii]